MDNLKISEINAVSGGYMIIKNMQNLESFQNLNDTLFKGGILHIAPSMFSLRDKNFPKSLVLRD